MFDLQSIVTLSVGFLILIVCIVLFIVLIVTKCKKRKLAKEKEIQEDEVVKVDPQFTKIPTVDYYDQNLKCFVMRNGMYMDFFKIHTKDLNSASEDELNWDAMKFVKLYKTYPDDLKIVTMNYPCNTSCQQEYWRYKMEHTKNPEIRKAQEKKIYQLEWLEKNSTSREFYLMYYSKDKNTFENNRRSILSVLSTGKMGLLEEISADKKIQILYKLMNKCSHIF